jgi:hypothetical protein
MSHGGVEKCGSGGRRLHCSRRPQLYGLAASRQSCPDSVTGIGEPPAMGKGRRTGSQLYLPLLAELTATFCFVVAISGRRLREGLFLVVSVLESRVFCTSTPRRLR